MVTWIKPTNILVLKIVFVSITKIKEHSWCLYNMLYDTTCRPVVLIIRKYNNVYHNSNKISLWISCTNSTGKIKNTARISKGITCNICYTPYIYTYYTYTYHTLYDWLTHKNIQTHHFSTRTHYCLILLNWDTAVSLTATTNRSKLTRYIQYRVQYLVICMFSKVLFLI